MRRDVGMGITSRDTVERDELASFRSPDRSSQDSPVSMKSPGSPRQVTDGSDTSDYTKKSTCDGNGAKSWQAPSSENDPPEKRAFSSMTRAGPSLQEEQSSSNCTSGPASEANKSVPQHEKLEEVEPLDISYFCTPGSLKVKAVLLARLADACTSGRLQVVCVL